MRGCNEERGGAKEQTRASEFVRLNPSAPASEFREHNYLYLVYNGFSKEGEPFQKKFY